MKFFAGGHRQVSRSWLCRSEAPAGRSDQKSVPQVAVLNRLGESGWNPSTRTDEKLTETEQQTSRERAEM